MSGRFLPSILLFGSLLWCCPAGTSTEMVPQSTKTVETSTPVVPQPPAKTTTLAKKTHAAWSSKQKPVLSKRKTSSANSAKPAKKSKLIGPPFLPSVALMGSIGGSGGGYSVAAGSLPPIFYNAANANYIIAPYGQDTSSCGSMSQPCQSMAQVDGLLSGTSSGATVLLRGGIYYLSTTFSPQTSGPSSSAPIVYAAYPNETPIITGAQPLIGWQHPTGTSTCAMNPACYSTTIPASFSYNFDYLIYLPAGYPPAYMAQAMSRRTESMNVAANPSNGPYNFNIGPVTGSCTNLSAASCVKVKASDISTIFNNSGPHNPPDIRYYNFNLSQIDALRMCTPNCTATGSNTELDFTGSPALGFLLSGRYVIVNSEEYFFSNATPGTFYVDCGSSACVTGSVANATIYYIANANENPQTDLILAPQLPQIIVDQSTPAGNSGANYLTFQGLTFVGDNFTTTMAGYTSQSGQQSISAALSFINTMGVTIDSSTIAHTSGWALEFTNTPNCTTITGCIHAPSYQNALTNSALYDIGASGLRLGRYPPCDASCAGTGNYTDQGNSNLYATNATTVENNIFLGMGRIYPNGEDGCIWIGSSNSNTITNNECGDSYGGGIAVGPAVIVTSDYEYNNQITLNYFHNLGEGVINDFGCVHFATFGGTHYNSMTGMGDVFQYNICRDMTAGDTGDGVGIYIDNNSQNVKVMDNLVYYASGPLFFNNGSPNCNQTGPPKGGCKNTVQSNIFAYSLQGPIRRGGNNSGTGSPVGDTLQDFTFQNNVVYFGLSHATSSGPQWTDTIADDFWDCGTNNTTPNTQPPCTDYFQFLSNDYYSPSLTFNLPMFLTVDVAPIGGARSPEYWYGLQQWQISNLPGEDGTSGGQAIYMDPLFVSPNYVDNNFKFQSTTVPNTIGFDYNNFVMYTYNAGPIRLPTAPAVQPSPAAFPLQPVSATQF